MTTRSDALTVAIDARFTGIPGVAHGGYLAGVLAGALGAASSTVRLRRPVPTARALRLDRVAADRVELRDGEDLLAEGTSAVFALDVPRPVSLAEAEAVARRAPAHEEHVFPDCFVCGTARRAGDGLRIFPGPVTGRKLVAAPWVPPAGPGTTPPELISAALDCVQLWALMTHAPADTPDRVVTAALATRFEGAVAAGEPHVAIGWPIGRDGRSWLAGAALLGPDGHVRALGRQTAAVVSGWGVPLGRDRRVAGHHHNDTSRR